jgi:type IX secretion system PorP/SprF family membrane protein
MKITVSGYRKYCLVLLAVWLCSAIHAQQYSSDPVGQYYRNGYLWNPAYAGSKDHPSVYALLNNSWIGFDGAPTLAILAGDMAFGRNSGIGLKLISDRSGLLQRTTATLDYSFILRLDNEKRLRIGISAGTFTQRLNNTPGAVDPLVYTFNAQKTTVDGSLGGVYENKNFTFSGAWYNLRNTFQKNGYAQVNVATTNFMISWRFKVASDSTSIKPLVAYKSFSAGGGLFAVGAQLERNKIFNTSLLWQNTGSVIGSIGLRIAKIGEVNFSYASNNRYGYGQLYEIGFGIGLN